MIVYIVVNHYTDSDDTQIDLEVTKDYEEAKYIVGQFHKSILNDFKEEIQNDNLTDDTYSEGDPEYEVVIDTPFNYIYNNCYIETKEI